MSHVLSQHYGYRVIAVEGNSDYSKKGEARVQSISTQIKGRVTRSGGFYSGHRFSELEVSHQSLRRLLVGTTFHGL